MIKPTLLSGAVIAALTALCGYQQFYAPSQRTLSTLQTRLAEEQRTQELRIQLARSLQDVERFRKRLPPQPETEWLVHEAGQLAEKTGVQLTSIAPQDPTKLGALTRLAVICQFRASYHQLGEFVSILENATSFLRIDHLEVARVQQGIAQIGLTVSTVYVPSGTALAAASATGSTDRGMP